MLTYLFIIIICYLSGAIPFSYIVVKSFLKKDLRKLGSGNVGATNAFRAGGILIGIISLILDASKAIIPLFLIKCLQIKPFFNISEKDFLLILGIFILIGHIFTIFLKFKGGKGVAVSLGILIFLFPRILLIALFIFIIIFLIFRIISLASLSAAFSVFILIFIFKTSIFAKLVLSLLVFLIFIRHKSNIKRLLKGEEKKLF